MIIAILSLSLFYALLFHLFRKRFREVGEARTYNHRKSVKVLQESLGGIRELILGGHYELFFNDFDHFNRQRYLNDSEILIKASIPRYLVEGFLIIIISSIALFYVILGNELNNLLPILASVSLGAYKLMQPVQSCFNTFGTLQANQTPLDILKRNIDFTKSFGDKKSEIIIFPTPEKSLKSL